MFWRNIANLFTPWYDDFSGIHIYPLYGNQSCHEDPLAKLKRELEKAKQEIREYERNKIKVPSKYIIHCSSMNIIKSVNTKRLFGYFKKFRIIVFTSKDLNKYSK